MKILGYESGRNVTFTRMQPAQSSTEYAQWLQRNKMLNTFTVLSKKPYAVQPNILVIIFT